MACGSSAQGVVRLLLPPTKIHGVQTTPQAVRIGGPNCQSDLAPALARASTRAHSNNRGPVEESRIALLNLSIIWPFHAAWIINELSGRAGAGQVDSCVSRGDTSPAHFARFTSVAQSKTSETREGKLEETEHTLSS
ncbi:hypothetical protein RRG08_059367 [Elysia crispata]|uniref:Uncharacterized protein n=1 Tax=Elysia crispata TaxID=231223 RepID=A0AAE1BDZ9_9GAST|nr:hypothetical protein RRG08_059367 [Elysia crispata]